MTSKFKIQNRTKENTERIVSGRIGRIGTLVQTRIEQNDDNTHIMCKIQFCGTINKRAAGII